MKPRGAHPHNRLTAPAIRAAKPGRHADGNGLYLVVTESGSKSWVLRTMVHGNRTDIGLGSARLVSLAEAREKARELRRVARAGGDPAAERDKGQRQSMTFAEAARIVHAEHILPVNRNEKANVQWLASLEREIFPSIGSTPIHAVKQANVLAALASVWLDRPETGRRIKQRIRVIFDWARAQGLHDGPHPTEGLERALPRQTRRVENFRAMDWRALPEFWPRLCAVRGMGALALRFLILTAARSGEVRGARWFEMNLDDALWIVPAERMKAGREHRVPLSGPAIDLLNELLPLATDAGGKTDDEALIFPSTRSGRPISDMTMTAALRRLGADATAHGFRSSFRDWCEDATNYPHAAKESALAHLVRDRTEGAYRRTDHLEKRVSMMATWGSFVASSGGKVVRLGA